MMCCCLLPDDGGIGGSTTTGGNDDGGVAKARMGDNTDTSHNSDTGANGRRTSNGNSNNNINNNTQNSGNNHASSTAPSTHPIGYSTRGHDAPLLLEEDSALRNNPNNIKLLPELHNDDLGKKCLVLDLDETLVHSSFRAVPGADFVIPVQVRFTPPPPCSSVLLLERGRNRDNSRTIIMSSIQTPRCCHLTCPLYYPPEFSLSHTHTHYHTTTTYSRSKTLSTSSTWPNVPGSKISYWKCRSITKS